MNTKSFLRIIMRLCLNNSLDSSHAGNKKKTLCSNADLKHHCIDCVMAYNPSYENILMLYTSVAARLKNSIAFKDRPEASRKILHENIHCALICRDLRRYNCYKHDIENLCTIVPLHIGAASVNQTWHANNFS